MPDGTLGNLRQWNQVEKALHKETPLIVYETALETSPTRMQSALHKMSANEQAEPKEPMEDWESFNLAWH
jgi:hypothetical protein